ncbi:MAG: SatD family protein [Daejeonella sp.]
MEKFIVITGDVEGFTSVSTKKREVLIKQTQELINSWVDKKGRAMIFRGDSFQLLFENTEKALMYAVQLRCWFKMQSPSGKKMLDARMAIGVGEVTYMGKSVLDSDGEAFHLSGRNFDAMEPDEYLRIATPNEEKNEQLRVILKLADILISGWTTSQAEVIYKLLEGKTQQQMADELNIVQSAINNRIRLSKWKEIEKVIRYISKLIDKE